MFPHEMIPQMFSNIKSIYQFHHDFLLPQLEARMLNWNQESKIGKLLQLHCHLVTKPEIITFLFNPLTPNDHYNGRTAPLTSKRCILYIYSTNTGTEYFKHGI